MYLLPTKKLTESQHLWIRTNPFRGFVFQTGIVNTHLYIHDKLLNYKTQIEKPTKKSAQKSNCSFWQPKNIGKVQKSLHQHSTTYFSGFKAKQLVAVAYVRGHPHQSTSGALVIFPNWEKSLLNLEEVATEAFPFEGRNSRWWRLWESHSSWSSNQIRNPLPENLSLLCWSLQLLHNKHCCSTWVKHPMNENRIK